MMEVREEEDRQEAISIYGALIVAALGLGLPLPKAADNVFIWIQRSAKRTKLIFRGLPPAMANGVRG